MLSCMRAVQITQFGGPEVLEVVDVPEPVPGDGQQLYDVSTAGVNYADPHQELSRNCPDRSVVSWTADADRPGGGAWPGRGPGAATAGRAGAARTAGCGA